MSRTLFIKLMLIGSLFLLLLLPLTAVERLVEERAAHRHEVRSSLMQSGNLPQTVTGPILVVPYDVLNPSDGTVTTRQHVILPQQLAVKGKLKSDVLYRSLYRVRRFAMDGDLSGQFRLEPADLPAESNTLRLGVPYLVVGVSDSRGIHNQPELQWQGQGRAFMPGSPLPMLSNGIHVPLPDLNLKAAADYQFAVNLQLGGSESLQFTPLGRDTRVSLESDWPHPSFDGNLSPTTRNVTRTGFTADWQTSWFATNLNQRVLEAVSGKERAELPTDMNFGVTLVEPGDVYQQAVRAVKYGVLFVLLTFVACFLMETLYQVRIHPIQYALVGTALAMFFLLLLALAEHIGFPQAYSTASVACVGLITYYSRYMLGSRGRALGFFLMLSILYGALYGLLQSEESALLLGTLLLFAVLTTIMLLTRRLDWYQVGAPTPQPAVAPTATQARTRTSMLDPSNPDEVR
ncbi:cell envelope integrity protein CreD [Leeia sp.]|uniref:cell envelope integrity protein CreD n=1 Tax=Leeia sp. TaxID=2884678 RepID=UPI0035B4D909